MARREQKDNSKLQELMQELPSPLIYRERRLWLNCRFWLLYNI